MESKTFTILTHQTYTNECWLIHKAGCRDIKREADKHASNTHDVTGTLQDALADVITEEVREMGYDEYSCKVHACCK